MANHRHNESPSRKLHLQSEVSDRTCVLTEDEVEGVLMALALVMQNFQVEECRTGKSWIPHMRTAFDKIGCVLVGTEEENPCPPF